MEKIKSLGTYTASELWWPRKTRCGTWKVKQPVDRYWLLGWHYLWSGRMAHVTADSSEMTCLGIRSTLSGMGIHRTRVVKDKYQYQYSQHRSCKVLHWIDSSFLELCQCGVLKTWPLKVSAANLRNTDELKKIRFSPSYQNFRNLNSVVPECHFFNPDTCHLHFTATVLSFCLQLTAARSSMNQIPLAHLLGPLLNSCLSSPAFLTAFWVPQDAQTPDRKFLGSD